MYASPARTEGVLAIANFLCDEIDMEMKLTAGFRKFPEGYAPFVEELPEFDDPNRFKYRCRRLE